MPLSQATRQRRIDSGWYPPSYLIAATEADRWRGDPMPTNLLAQQPVGAGVTRLGRVIRERFPVVYSVGARSGYAIEPGNASTHHAGRAADLMIRTIDGRPDPRGDEVANWLLANSKALGVQYMIWRGTEWSSSTGKTRVYPGTEDHFDHIHVDMNLAGARGALVDPATIRSGAGVLLLVAGGAAAWWWLKKRK